MFGCRYFFFQGDDGIRYALSLSRFLLLSIRTIGSRFGTSATGLAWCAAAWSSLSGWAGTILPGSARLGAIQGVQPRAESIKLSSSRLSLPFAAFLASGNAALFAAVICAVC